MEVYVGGRRKEDLGRGGGGSEVLWRFKEVFWVVFFEEKGKRFQLIMHFVVSENEREWFALCFPWLFFLRSQNIKENQQLSIQRNADLHNLDKFGPGHSPRNSPATKKRKEPPTPPAKQVPPPQVLYHTEQQGHEGGLLGWMRSKGSCLVPLGKTVWPHVLLCANFLSIKAMISFSLS